MKNNRFFIKTFGCQMNVADSGAFADVFERAGYAQAQEQSEADVILVNTCTVRQHAEERALSEIGHLKKWKNRDPENRVLILAGCVASRLGESVKKRFPQVDLIVGAEQVEMFPQIISEKLSAKRVHSSNPVGGVNKVTAFVPVMRGCNNFCSYCIVPYVRGREKSRKPPEIIAEIKKLAGEGVKEVTLLGQNVNSYRNGKTDFADLLTIVNAIDGISRIRFMTSHPKDLSDKIIETIASLDKLCPHVHLPLQSGSNRILKLMNRGYTREHYIKLVEKIRKQIPGTSVTTDLLVGFPSETEKDFKDTVDAVKKCRFDFAYVFKYSPREKTAASKMDKEVSKEIIEKRHAKLLELCNNLAQKSNKKLEGETVKVLAESITENSELWGKTPDNRAVYVKRDEIASRQTDGGQASRHGGTRNDSSANNLIGSTINAKILNAKIHSLGGIISTKCRQKPQKKKTR